MTDCVCIGWGYAPEMGPYKRGHHPRCSSHPDSAETAVRERLRKFDGTFPMGERKVKVKEPTPPGSKQ